jgi:hypothetical protein
VNARLTRNALRHDVIGEFGTCKAYSIGKARQKKSIRLRKTTGKFMERDYFLI